ncbi:MAG: VTC domain-containing protein [Planctomycetota bacterium]
MQFKSNYLNLRRLLTVGKTAIGKTWAPAHVSANGETPTGAQRSALRQSATPPADPTAGFRYEVKYTCDELDRAALEGEIRCLHAMFRPAHPTRAVNSIYFDSVALRDLHDNVAGLPDRSKMRLRWYGNDPRSAQTTLEYKLKRGLLGTKQTVQIPDAIDLTTIDWRTLRDQITAADLGALEPMFREANQATALVRYKRDYYVSANGHVRLTLDRAVQVFDQLGRSGVNLRWPLPEEPVVIVELKTAAEHRHHLVDVCQEFPLRPSAHSKYSTGMLGLLAEIA